MNVKEADIDRMWEKLGFRIDRKKKDIKANLYVGETLILRTYRSHGSGKMSGNIPHKIRGQMKLRSDEFAAAINCPLDRPGYLAILRSKGWLPADLADTG